MTDVGEIDVQKRISMTRHEYSFEMMKIDDDKGRQPKDICTGYATVTPCTDFSISTTKKRLRVTFFPSSSHPFVRRPSLVVRPSVANHHGMSVLRNPFHIHGPLWPRVALAHHRRLSRRPRHVGPSLGDVDRALHPVAGCAECHMANIAA